MEEEFRVCWWWRRSRFGGGEGVGWPCGAKRIIEGGGYGGGCWTKLVVVEERREDGQRREGIGSRQPRGRGSQGAIFRRGEGDSRGLGISFVIASIMLMAGATLNDQKTLQKMYSGNYCYVVKVGVFFWRRIAVPFQCLSRTHLLCCTQEIPEPTAVGLSS
ncbi:hypothetical protein KSP39_PZI007857 [Platanthera zijinensis]|uniref:Uncharacterized protein n=1 Tax=Platanthera zijinensis TaxID=2320716 RepID=A0AAP0G910_9ASPA